VEEAVRAIDLVRDRAKKADDEEAARSDRATQTLQ
jgi:hypothetical protein